jgi:predicted RNase H-like nuclease (RuvC/YqgF family)
MTTSDYIEKAVEWLGLTSAGGLMGYFGGRRKQQAEGIEAAISVWEKTVKHLEEQVAELRRENIELRIEIQELKRLIL